jgi:hypothetical protein
MIDDYYSVPRQPQIGLDAIGSDLCRSLERFDRVLSGFARAPAMRDDQGPSSCAGCCPARFDSRVLKSGRDYAGNEQQKNED